MTYHNATEDLPGVDWVTSSFSGAQGNCVQMAALPTGEVALRDSKNPSGPALTFTKAEIAAMLDGAAAGEFRELI